MTWRPTAAAILGLWMMTPQAGASVRPSPGRPACKIYPTLATSVSVNAGARTVQNFTNRYDRATNQLHTDVTYSDSRGIRQQLHYVHHYASLADFINEVVRESGYRGQTTAGLAGLAAPAAFFEPGDVGHGLYLSSAFSGNYRTVASVTNNKALNASGAGATGPSGRVDWSINTIPPLKLYQRAVITGDIQSTSTNSFDAAGRQTGFVNTDPNGPAQRTTYTAWDPQGRPTAGTRTAPGGTANATVTIVYDDLARTMTTTVRTPTAAGPMTFVDVETFDWNGNVIRFDMKSVGVTSTTTNTFQQLAVICHGPIAPPVIQQPNAGPPAPGYQSKGTMSASINGAQWNATSVRGGVSQQQIGPGPTDTATILSIGGSNPQWQFSIGVNITNGPGTYDVQLNTTPTPAAPPQMPRGTANAILFSVAGQGAWQADPSYGRGTVTITSVSSTGAAGSFAFVLDPTPGTPASGTRTVTGTFNVTF